MSGYRLLLHDAERMVREKPDLKSREISELLEISVYCAWRMLQHIKSGRMPTQWEVAPTRRKSFTIDREILADILSKYPYASLRDLQRKYLGRTGIRVSVQGIRLALRKKENGDGQ